MSQRTDYLTLGLVGVVGIVAIVAMMWFAVPNSEPLEYFQSDFVPFESVTGAIVKQPVTIPSSEGKHDFNDDGVLDEQDSLRLADAIDDQKCPYKKDCDINNDLRLDIYDLAELNKMILQERAQRIDSFDKESSRLVKHSINSNSLVAARLG